MPATFRRWRAEAKDQAQAANRVTAVGCVPQTLLAARKRIDLRREQDVSVEIFGATP